MAEIKWIEKMTDIKDSERGVAAVRQLAEMLADAEQRSERSTVMAFIAADPGSVTATEELAAWIEAYIEGQGWRLDGLCFVVLAGGDEFSPEAYLSDLRQRAAAAGLEPDLAAGVLAAGTGSLGGPGTELIVVEAARRLAIAAAEEGAGAVWRLSGDEEDESPRRLALNCLIYRELARANAERAHQMASESRVDFLTGLANRRGFEEAFERLAGRARHGAEPLALIYMDSDSLKEINDTDGHDAGDRFISALAATLKEVVRHSDLISRWGADEFAVAGLCSSREEALALAERIRGAIEERTQGTVSVGIYWGVPTEAMTALKDADTGLYRAKKSGKNRVCWM